MDRKRSTALMDGPYIDLVKLAGIDPTTDEWFDVLTDIDWKDSVMEADGQIIETLEL